ncbi:transcriptional regulator [bacterium]|nr:transcriptional regulator [bacterium]
MNTKIVFTLAGPDQIGIVDRITARVLDAGGNIGESRMARLGGDFALIMLISVPTDREGELTEKLASFQKEGFQTFTRKTVVEEVSRYQGWLPFQIRVNGADHEGIINSITHYLASRGINIESMNTDSVQAPMSGTLLFSMEAVVMVPPNLPPHTWRDGLTEVGNTANVDVGIAAFKG